MKPTHEELCHAIVAVGKGDGEARAVALYRLAELGLIQPDLRGWILTPTGKHLLGRLEAGEAVSELE